MPNSCRTIIKKCLHKGAINQKEYEKLMRKLDLIDIVNGLKPDRVEVALVVRCKDCKYMPTGDGANHDLEFPEDFKCPCQCEDFWYSWKPDDNWFCGNGKRREDGKG